MSEVLRLIKVGIADVKIGSAPDKIRTSGLGSCVGVILYDEVKRVAGMAHVMLPDSTMAKQGRINRFKYADTAMDDLLGMLIEAGASKFRLKSKLAGGAQMFHFKSESDLMRIGPRNVEAVKKKLLHYRIPIISEDVGGKSGRTIVFDPETSRLHIRKVNHGEVTI
ncbi:chemotaxis protein CheD [Halobacillus locisalis]|uniref:Probable chemoreceptor glutamine deamidase CheD n=1 Tax=Halobacillus locisalis TaxID=220753 RepID=A0A838CQC9_9BACI|nr:chemotaxis protein CheD [Halobacillus locisalis]MBA2174088.1 chemotaxis protein CheD [Halobacillus locisalis]